MNGQISQSIPSSAGGMGKMLVGIIILVVIVVGFLSYYYLILAPEEGVTITSAAEATQKIFDLQGYLEAIANDLANISAEL